MQLQFLVFFIKTTASSIQTMISTVVLAFALVSSTIALPLTTQEQITGSEGFQQIHTEVPQPQFVEKTGSEFHAQQVQQNSPVTKVESLPVNVDHPQVSYTENPVLLPIQPLSVVPQVGQVLRPVIVPAEAITAGRVIITGIETIQQRNFPDEIAAVEPQVAYQQVVQPASYTPVQSQVLEPNQQSYHSQPVEKQSSVQQQFTPVGQGFVPVQVQTVQEQLYKEQQAAENYNPAPVEQNSQVYSVQPNVQQVVVPEYPEKQASYQGVTGYTPVQAGQQQQVQQVEESQVSNPQGYSRLQPQGSEHQQQQVQSGATENVEKQVPQVLNAQKHPEYQQDNQQVSQQVYDVQQSVEKQGQYPQGFIPVQTQSVEQVTYQQPSQRVEPFEQVQVQQVNKDQSVEHVQQFQTYPVEQQVYSAQQPSQVSHQQQPVGYVPEQSPKTTEVEQQVHSAQPEQVVNYASETAYNFGEKIPQHTAPFQTLSGVPHAQTSPVQTSVVANQE